MNKIIATLILISFVSCGNDVNQKMTLLLNEQKSISYKIDSVTKLNRPFLDTFVVENPEIVEGRRKNIEFEIYKKQQIQELERDLKRVLFSIDSLSRMR